MFDSHCHLDDPRIDISMAIRALEQAGVSAAMIAGYGPERTGHAAALCATHPMLCRAVGLHPWWLATRPDDADAGFAALIEHVQAPDVCAVGEIGVDVTRRKLLSADVQRRHFARGLAVANGAELPVVLHIVGWHGHALAELAACQPRAGGVVHRFGGPREVLDSYIDLGLHLSLDVIAFRRDPAKVRMLARAIPNERLVLETDWPERGVTYAESLAQLADLHAVLAADRGMERAAFEALIDANNRRLYRLDVG